MVKLLLTLPQIDAAKAVVAWMATDAEYKGHAVKVADIGLSEATATDWRAFAAGCDVWAAIICRIRKDAYAAQELADDIRRRVPVPETEVATDTKPKQRGLFD